MTSLFQKFIVLGHHIDDTEDEKIRKSSLLMMSAPFAMAGVVWGILYFVNGLTLPGSIPFTYGILSILSIVHFAKTTKYRIFRSSQLLLILILPFALQLSLGGFIPASAVIMWALVSPAGALIFFSKKQALQWFVAFILLVVIAFLVNDILPEYLGSQVDESFINALFLMNIIGISSIVFMLQYYFVSKRTELKEAIEEKSITLEQQTEKLKELDTVKSRFFANISHEFRTPLTLILGLINKQIENPEVKPDIDDSETLKRNAQRLLQLINQLLDLSKLESGALQLEVAKDDIILFTKKVSLLFAALADDKNIVISLNGHRLNKEQEHDKIALLFDREKLQKILSNLISNAIKFTPAHGNIDISVSLTRQDDQESDEYVVISIANSGDGIPEESLPHIFDRFYQVDAESTRQYEGTGIGLALVKELMELHQGSVSAGNSNGLTIFTLKLPLALDLGDVAEIKSDDSEPVPEINNEIASGSVTTSAPEHDDIDSQESDSNELEILIVEDNADLRKYIGSILAGKYKVLEAVDGVDGFNNAEKSIPDLIISDVMMPNMDGYELCRILKENQKTDHIPVILLTAKATRENKLEGLELGADDYLVKPFDEAELLVRIKNLISLREQLQKKYQQEVWLKPKTIKVASVHQKFLEDIKEAIEQNIDNDQFGVEDLGMEIAMSRSQVHRKLKALTDQPATTFIRNYRLHRAAELLLKETGSVTDIAYQVGFSSQTYFSKCFQELFNCTPSEYKVTQG